jgi:tRNA nucleotidyltransferase (CCA-adding enzyme)
MLEREGFRVLRSDAFASSSKAVILLEMEVSNLPNIKKHIGPPTTSENAEIFKRKHENVYIEGGRFIAMIPRRYTHAKDLLEREIGTCSLGKNISHSIKNGEVRKNEEIILFDGFNVFMRKYFN